LDSSRFFILLFFIIICKTMDKNIIQKIKELSEEYFDDIIKIRRDIHKNPELSFQEEETSLYIQNELSKLVIPFEANIAGTGVVGKLIGDKPSDKVIALRADIDALPIEEENSFDFKSQNKGVMHACGHDAHTASLLGTARILNSIKEHWGGTILLIFQPGEERYPGGASLMLKEGIFDKLKPEVVIGQHVLPELETGKVGFKPGIYMASADEIYITIKGRGGHGALPENFDDTILAASQVVVSMQQVVSRIVPPSIPTVLTFGKIVGNGANNIIPAKVEIAGTLRTLNEEWRAKIKDKIKEIAKLTAKAYNCQCDIDIKDGFPMVDNDEKSTEKAISFAKQYLGDQKVEKLETRMTAEDFGYFTQKYPSVYYRFGVKQEKGETSNLHTSNFNLNENSLKTSMGNMTWIAINFLNI